MNLITWLIFSGIMAINNIILVLEPQVLMVHPTLSEDTWSVIRLVAGDNRLGG
jgi:hypothetical protein